MSTIPHLAGTTLSPSDRPRLNKQEVFVYDCLRDGRAHTLPEMRDKAHARGHLWEIAALSARIRDLRKAGLHIDRKNLGNGLFTYTLVKPGQGVLWRE